MRGALPAIRVALGFRLWTRAVGLIWQVGPAVVLLLLTITVVLGVTPALQVGVTRGLTDSVSNAIADPMRRLDEPLHWGFISVALLIAITVLRATQGYVQEILQLRLLTRVGLQVIEKAESLGLEDFEDADTYDRLQRAQTESSHRPYQVFQQIIGLLSDTTSLISVSAVLFYWNWVVALAVMLSPVPTVLVQSRFSRRSYDIEYGRSTDRRRQWYMQFLLTNPQNVKEVKHFRLGPLFTNRYKEYGDRFYRMDSRLLGRTTRAVMPLQILAVGLVAGAQIFAITSAIDAGQIGLLAAHLMAITVSHSAMQSLLRGLNGLHQSKLYIGNLFEFLDARPSLIKSGSRPFPRALTKGIEFRDVTFRYPGSSQNVLDGFCTFIPARKSTALIGHNGAGKSTIVKLLARLYAPTSGQILVDDVPIEDYELVDLQRNMSIIFQDFVRYEATVHENIGFGSVENLTDRLGVTNAARDAGVEPFVSSLRSGYETQLGRMFPNGQDLSTGQWQKLALARAKLGTAAVVMMDEPTSAMDAEAEADLFGRFRAITEGATVLLIAHRFSTIRGADRIIVVEKGEVVETGDHESLIVADGEYARLFAMQAAGYA